MSHRPRHLLLITTALLTWFTDSLATERLNNGLVRAEFDHAALTRLSDVASGRSVAWEGDSSTLTINGDTWDARDLRLLRTHAEKEQVTYAYEAGDATLEVIYELRPGWRFIAKRLVLHTPASAVVRVNQTTVFKGSLRSPILRELKASNQSGAVFLRLGDSGPPPGFGLFLALQNPFLKWERKDQDMSLSYAPEMEWRGAYGPFTTDRVCVGIHALTGSELPARNAPEWKYFADPDQAFAGKAMFDRAEFEAMTRCVAAFARFKPGKSLRVHVPWCENDYQIDVGTPEGRTEWKRIIDQCAALGVDHALFTPGNQALAPLSENADAWGWENCLWLGLGQKIRKGEWNIAADPIPDSVQDILDHARSKGVKLVAYAYPTLGWKQDPSWTAWCGGKTGGYDGVDTGVRSFQDWFVEQLVAFQKRTGISGYSFDHWWIAYETRDGKKPTSKYAQWFGCRRILETLRQRIPDVVIDGRQQYQWFGPWTWLAGSYPHPTTNDEQPGSFENFPDLHFSRVSGDRQRWATWYYHMEQFTPWEMVPGYMTHQTPRGDAKGECVRDRPFHVRDWDLLGWRYSVISSIGTAPFNHAVNLIPARDETEFRSFGPADQAWLRGWMDWTDQHRNLLRHLRPILGPPVLGRVDGTAAVVKDRGVVFLFNPNYRALDAAFVLGDDLGPLEDGDYLLRELYPQAGRLIGKPGTGVWRRGDEVRLRIKGPEALVLEILPAREVKRPALLQARGAASFEGDRLSLSEVQGEMGADTELLVLLPRGRKVGSLSLNGKARAVSDPNGDVLKVPVRFAGERFEHCEAVGQVGVGFAARTFQAQFTLPRRVLDQLAARRIAWPVAYTPEELLATWRGSDRLLLFIQIADPDDKWTVGLKLNGKDIEVRKAYSDVFPVGRERTFTGFYVDLSQVTPGERHTVEVMLPDGLQPGQFQGLFFENVETEFTHDAR
jgi:hypothetical protein